MKKHKSVYRYYRYNGHVLHAKREIPYHIKLSSRLILDELCFNWNKAKLEAQINESIDTANKEQFIKLGEQYNRFLWE